MARMSERNEAAQCRRCIALAAATALLLFGSAAEASVASARTLNGSDTAHLRLVHQHESVLYEQGSASGALSGTMHATLTVGSVFTGTFTIVTSHGSVTGHGSAKPHGTGRYQSFKGTMYVTKGSGQYKHVHGRTALYGTFDRRTFDVVVKTRGRLSY